MFSLSPPGGGCVGRHSQ